MLLYSLCILFCLITTSAQASEEALWQYSLFNDNDSDDTLEPLKTSPTITSYEHGKCLHFQGILMADSGEWTLWVNGGKLLKSKQNHNLLVERLSRNQATFKWMLADKTYTFTLHLQESFHVSTGTVKKGGCAL